MKKLIVLLLLLLCVVSFAQNMDWYGNGGGTKGKVYHISTEDELKGLRHLVDYEIDNFLEKTIILNSDIILKGVNSPIGASKAARQFRGIFDGNGHSISIGKYNYTGLFGYVGEGGQIKNLTINIPEINVSGDNVGGLAEYYASSEAIENCIVNSSISMANSNYMGGLVGIAKNITIKNSSFSGNVHSKPQKNHMSSGSSISGGLVGSADTITVIDSYVKGDVSSTVSGYNNYDYSYSGGLVGEVKIATITNSYSKGDVSSKAESLYPNYSGGLIGLGNVNIVNSYSIGNVSASSKEHDTYLYSVAGGLVGEGGGNINNSYSIGKVSAGSYAGGIIGHNDCNGTLCYKMPPKIPIKISNSYSKGNVSAIYSGGFTGLTYFVEINNSFSENKISSSLIAGGLIAASEEAKIINSYNVGNVSVKGNEEILAGGLLGYAKKSTIENSYSSGEINAVGGSINGKGGIFGRWSAGINKFVYYNSAGANMPAGVGGWPENVLGVAQENLKKKESFADWDFTEVWAIDTNINSGYPYLSFFEKEREQTRIEKEADRLFMQNDSFKDSRDNKKYKMVKIGDQIWMAENLNFKPTNGSKCYDNKPANCQKYGQLYDWATAIKSCPTGWRLPNNDDWHELFDFAEGKSAAGKKLKTKTGWNKNKGTKGNGTDAYGFAALPAGMGGYDGVFYNASHGSYWWSSTEFEGNNRWIEQFYFAYLDNEIDGANMNTISKNVVLSVRCIKD